MKFRRLPASGSTHSRFTDRHVSSPISAVRVAAIPVLSKRYLFRVAWQIARSGAARFGGLVGTYFAAALQESWMSFREDLSTQECHRIAAAGSYLRRSSPSPVLNRTILAAVKRADARLGEQYTKAW